MNSYLSAVVSSAALWYTHWEELMKYTPMGSLPFPQWRYRQLHTLAEGLRKKGLSYKEIRRSVPVSKATLSAWCRDIPLTKKQIARLGARYDTQLRGAKANQRKSAERKQATRSQAITEVPRLTSDAMKVVGAMMYWAEGSKNSGTAIANSDPTFVVFFVHWLKQVLNRSPENLTAHLHLHRGQNESKEKNFWSKLTGIPLRNFRKTFYKPQGTGHRKNILYHGTIRVSVCGVGVELLRHRILGWAEGVARQLVPEKVIQIHYRGRVGR